MLKAGMGLGPAAESAPEERHLFMKSRLLVMAAALLLTAVVTEQVTALDDPPIAPAAQPSDRSSALMRSLRLRLLHPHARRCQPGSSPGGEPRAIR